MKAYLEIELPKSCCECDIKSWDGEDDVCPFSGISALSIGRQDDCPLVPVLPHGDLIERDELPISTAVPLDGKPYQYVHIDNIKGAPTIIPAGEEN